MTEARAVLGVGIDLVETERMDEVMTRWGGRFLDRVFLPAEKSYCETKARPCQHYAGRFAVKEAVTKAFGTGIGPSLGWLDIEVTRDEATGAPSVQLSARGRALADAMGVRSILISLSHARRYAVAQALLLGKGEA